MTRHSDPMERMIAAALTEAGENFTGEDDPRNMKLDFYLNAHRVHIEVKQFYSERSVRQMERAPFGVLVQGRFAVEWLAALIRDASAHRKAQEASQ